MSVHFTVSAKSGFLVPPLPQKNLLDTFQKTNFRLNPFSFCVPVLFAILFCVKKIIESFKLLPRNYAYLVESILLGSINVLIILWSESFHVSNLNLNSKNTGSVQQESDAG